MGGELAGDAGEYCARVRLDVGTGYRWDIGLIRIVDRSVGAA
jgi:hypothetical protein